MPEIDISPLKNAAKQLPHGVVRDLIEDQKKEMDVDDFLASIKTWEKALKKEVEKT